MDKLSSFNYDKCNPYRRYCKKCDQQQLAYSIDYNPLSNIWWETNGRIEDENCSCHKHTRC